MTRKMIFEFLTKMRDIVLLFLLILGLSGCEFFALSFAPGKKPLADNSELANQASKVFWETLHQEDYSIISKPMTLLKAAYLQNPYDAKIAARIEFFACMEPDITTTFDKHSSTDYRQCNSGKKVL